jgi:hypothetical protein
MAPSGNAKARSWKSPILPFTRDDAFARRSRNSTTPYLHHVAFGLPRPGRECISIGSYKRKRCSGSLPSSESPFLSSSQRTTMAPYIDDKAVVNGTADDVSSGVQNLKLKNAEPVQVEVSPSLSLALNPF